MAEIQTLMDGIEIKTMEVRCIIGGRESIIVHKNNMIGSHSIF
jgi:hypothetical protein